MQKSSHGNLQRSAPRPMQIARSINHGRPKETVIMNNGTSFIITLAASALLQACNQSPDPAKVQGDVTKAQADGQKMIVDAQAKLDQVNAQANKEVVNAQVDANAANAANATNPPPPATAADNDVAKARKDANEDVVDAQFNLEKV